MDSERAIVIFCIHRKDGTQEILDLEIPLYITANELVAGLNEAYHLGINTENIRNCYMRAEHPIALLRGSKMLSEFHVMNGTKIMFIEGENG